jgi:drug/metabolite transporter (DMT)-like permease
MQKIATKVSRFCHNIPGKIYLWVAIFIYASASSFTRKLTLIGSQHLIDGKNPISFGSVLLVGNICGLFFLIFIHRHNLQFNYFKQLSLQDWFSIITVAFLSGALAPSVTFEAISRTMVTNVILIGRIEVSLFLALSVWFLREKVNSWKIIGEFVSFVGVVVTVSLQALWEDISSPEIFNSMGVGEILTAIGAVAFAISSIISKARLMTIPLGLFVVFRTTISTVFLLFAAISIYGRSYFKNVVLSPFLWQWMLIYGGIIVALAQTLWFAGLKNSSSSHVSVASAFSPIAAVLGAYIILGEVPTLAQIIGGGIIFFGIGLSHIGNSPLSS